MCSCHRAEANILHADLDSFFASVEQRDDPRLQGRPVVVGAGVVLAASYEAKAFGVKTAMPGGKARRAVPADDRGAVALRGLLGGEQGGVRDLRRHVAQVEGMSIDEAFLDVRGMRRIAGAPAEIAARLRARVRRRGRAADHGRRRADEVPGQGRLGGGEAGRAAGGRARGRAGVPAPAAGREAVGRRRQDGGQAARARDHDGGGGRRDRRDRARRDARARVGAASCTRSRTIAIRGA